METPFSIPKEDEHLDWPVDSEALQVAENRRKRVQDSTTASSRIKRVAKLRDEDIPMAQTEKLQKALKAAATAPRDAVSLVTISSQRKEGKNVRDLVQKKREMFLVQMALDVKKAEILKLDEKARRKEDALKRSQQMIDEDFTRFNNFLEANDDKAHKAMRIAEEKTRARQDKQKMIAYIKTKINHVQSDIAKQKEHGDEAIKYRAFLDRLTPQEFKTRMGEQKRARKANRRKAWIEARVAEQTAQMHQEIRDMEAEVTDGLEQLRRRLPKKKYEEEVESRRDEVEKRSLAIRKRYPNVDQIASRYADESSGDEGEMYFQEPWQLMEIFTQLEEQNLFLIQNGQDIEQSLEEVENTIAKTEKEMGEKAKALKRNREELKVLLRQEEAKVGKLKERLKQKGESEHLDNSLAEMFKKVSRVYESVVGPMETDPDVLSMLGAIETKLEEVLTRLDEIETIDGELILGLERKKDKDRRERMRKFKFQEVEREREERLKNSLQRSQAPVHRKTGKQIMFRSAPVLEDKRVVVDNSEELRNRADYHTFGMFISGKDGAVHTEVPPDPTAPRGKDGEDDD